ncbi:betaine--homocysteine S-methyltransferase 1 [Lepeophtheirus salmonis]|uniref:betaine--homocysteine S-methyltransferase 1 n=1 Tax=Lepeophtheirus salmonis TaxID=72036 RepID=UPI001AE49FE3|nr:betaine--homocysteine S-methyltransferase 1-like [Lepeophtheirus salmonis]
MPEKKGLLERLAEGPVIGDGGFVFALEKRGYVKAGPWTPECLLENPEAVLQLHREFAAAGADIVQALTFYGSDDKLENRGNDAKNKFTGRSLNAKAAELAKKVAGESGALTLGGVCQCPSYLSGKSKEEVQEEFRKQVNVFVEEDLDFVLAEYFEHIEEMEWAIEVLKESNKPVAASMCIGPEGDLHGVSSGECAVRMVKAGANVVGINCHFDPFICLEGMKLMKQALLEADLLNKVHLMVQPLAYHTPDAGKQGFIDLPEFPFALESRICTRFDMHRYAREAYELGIRYIGGCCGFEPYHIRALSEELVNERKGKLGQASQKHLPWGGGLKMHTKPWVRARADKKYWENLNPASGRAFSSSFSKPDAWGITKGSKELEQQKEATSDAQINELIGKAKRNL